jgi:hypothetical protein
MSKKSKPARVKDYLPNNRNGTGQASTILRHEDSRFAVDALLRKRGYRIHSRSGQGDPMWEKAGKLYRQHEVEALLDANELADARYIEFLYHEERTG